MKREPVWSFIRREHPLVAREIAQSTRTGLDTIDMARIGQSSRRYVWQCVQTHMPALAQLLSDVEFLELKAHFGAAVQIECRVVCQAIAKDIRVSRGAIAA